MRCLQTFLAVFLIGWSGAEVRAGGGAAAESVQPRPKRVVILISLDGARPDGVEQADTPNIDKLIESGAASKDAQTTYPFITLPSHIAMLSGLTHEHHGILLNRDVDNMPPMPCKSLFDYCDTYGLPTLMIAGKSKLRMIRPVSEGDKPSYIVPLDEVGATLKRSTENVIPSFIFIHSSEPDVTGHLLKWMSGSYLRAIARADQMVGEVVQWVHDNDLWDRTLIIISADHGGHGRTHKGEHPADLTIPWIVGGGLAVEARLEGRIDIYDTAPTILQVLGLPIPEGLDGAAVPGLACYPKEN
jgi:hypothetical protein